MSQDESEPNRYEVFLGWMYPGEVTPEIRASWPPDVLLERIEADRPQYPAHEWALRYLNNEEIEVITREAKYGDNVGRVYIAIGSLARKLAQKSTF